MDFFSDYPTLSPRDQTRFRAVVTRLWAGDVIVPGSPMRPDPDWSFIERYHPLVASYLSFGGWELEFRAKPSMARAVHSEGRLRATFNKFQSMVTLVLRLTYHEQMGTRYDREECRVRVAEIRDRLHQEGVPISHLSMTRMRDTLRALARYRLVTLGRGFGGADDEEIIIATTIEAVLPENLSGYREKLLALATAADGKTVSETPTEETAADEQSENA